LVGIAALLLVTGVGGVLHRTWARPMAILVHGVMLVAGLVSLVVRWSSSDPVFYGPAAILYFYCLQFWMSRRVTSWFAARCQPQ
jgi:hypothetical protein